MTAAASVASNVIYEGTYNPSAPKAAVEDATKWAEGRLTEMKEKLNALYPWRTKS
jgi:hypothetical protein